MGGKISLTCTHTYFLHDDAINSSLYQPNARLTKHASTWYVREDDYMEVVEAVLRQVFDRFVVHTYIPSRRMESMLDVLCQTCHAPRHSSFRRSLFYPAYQTAV